MFRWQLEIQEYRGRMTITHRPGRNHQNADLLSRFPLPNDASNPGGVDDVDIIEILSLHVVDLASKFYKQIADSYQKCKDLRTLVKLLSDETNSTNQQLLLSLDKEYKDLYDSGHFFFEDELLYYRKAGGHRLVIHPSMKDDTLKLCHDDILAGHFSEEISLEYCLVAWVKSRHDQIC